MRAKRFYAIVGVLCPALLLGAGARAGAQSVGRMLETDVWHSAGDVWAVWTSPFHANGSDWLIAAGAVAGSAAISPLDAAVDQWAYKQQHEAFWNFLNPVREGGVAFSGKTITPVAVGALAVGLIAKNERLQEGLFGCLSAYVSTSVVRTFVIYPLVARTRPDSSRSGTLIPPAHQGDQYHFSVPGTSDWGRHAFPGGHVANVAACASFLTNRFSMGFMEPVVWVVAGGVGVGRILDRRHWLSDQVFGTVFGYAAGRVVAIRSSHRAAKALKTADAGAPSSNFFIAPGPAGMEVGWERIF